MYPCLSCLLQGLPKSRLGLPVRFHMADSFHLNNKNQIGFISLRMRFHQLFYMLYGTLGRRIGKGRHIIVLQSDSFNLYEGALPCLTLHIKIET